MSDPDRALETHAREELGIDPTSLGSPIGAAVGSFTAFAMGAMVPLAPWSFVEGRSAVISSIVLTVLAAAAVGFLLGSLTGRSRLFSAGRQVAIAVVAAGVTFGVGRLVGVDSSG
jgi:VIT1/CCC1 family predicted Fe2+/Mn2+ transporter